MTMLTARVMRASQVQRAYFRLGWLNLVSYPVNLFTILFRLTLAILGTYFVDRLVPGQSSVAGDYFTFAVVGSLTLRLLDSGLGGFGRQVAVEIQTGRLEAYLVEPVPWVVLPFGMVQFDLVLRSITTVLGLLLAISLGANIQTGNLLIAAVVLLLGVAVTLAIGVLGSSLKLLSKRSDPFIALYTAIAGLFSGALFPIELIPSLLRPISYAIPQTYVISVVRHLLMPQSNTLSGPSLRVSVIVLICLSAVLYPIALSFYRVILEQGRRYGTLAGY